MEITILGIPFKIIEVEVIDESYEGVVQGKIIHSKGEIYVKKSLPPEVKKSVIYHEVLHGILDLLGYSELSNDEQFVQCVSNVVYQMFDFKKGVIKWQRQ